MKMGTLLLTEKDAESVPGSHTARLGCDFCWGSLRPARDLTRGLSENYVVQMNIQTWT